MATTQRDYYEILGVDRTADEATLKRAYRKLAMQYHPDRNADPDAAERFKEVNAAYEVLSDPSQRARYDRYGHAGVGNGNGFGGFEGFSGFEGFGDIFDTFFGGGQRRSGGRRGPARGSDLRYTLKITFEEAAFGADRTIEYQRYEQCEECGGSGAEPGTEKVTCPDCGGAGEVRRVQRSVFGQFVNVSTCVRCRGEGTVITTPCPECEGSGRQRRKRKISVKIPAGVDDGAQIRLTGEGDFGSRGGAAGNLYVVIEVQRHEHFERLDDHVIYQLPINIAQAALGAKVVVPTIDGEEELEIPAGTQSGEQFVLRGKGIPHLRGSGRGDQIIHATVCTPEELTEEQRDLLERLAKTMGTPTLPKKHKGFFDWIRDKVEGI